MNVFDASSGPPAFVANEAGAEVVETASVDEPCCSAANWSEVAEKVRAVNRDWGLVRALLLAYEILSSRSPSTMPSGRRSVGQRAATGCRWPTGSAWPSWSGYIVSRYLPPIRPGAPPAGSGRSVDHPVRRGWRCAVASPASRSLGRPDRTGAPGPARGRPQEHWGDVLSRVTRRFDDGQRMLDLNADELSCCATCWTAPSGTSAPRSPTPTTRRIGGA